MDILTDSSEAYTREKICQARAALALGQGTLPERVQEAYKYLLRSSEKEEFALHFKRIMECLRTVRKSDWSKVTREEYNTVAALIFEMGNSLPAIPSAFPN
jgi:hypothetical protein